MVRLRNDCPLWIKRQQSRIEKSAVRNGHCAYVQGLAPFSL